LKDVLNSTARKPVGLSWGNPVGQRFGNGILDAKTAFSELNATTFSALRPPVPGDGDQAGAGKWGHRWMHELISVLRSFVKRDRAPPRSQ
jgi:hypothetical protein